MSTTPKTTDFGFETVDFDEKQQKVAEVFHRVASRYDLMNDLMSLGIHRFWKWFTLHLSHVRQGQKCLDLAGGSGDLTRVLSERVGDTGQVVLADINQSMLMVGRDRMLNEGRVKNIDYVLANAECLPFKNNYFDCITMAFGLRNVTDKQKALNSMYRVLKPGGKLMVLEFSEPVMPGLKPIYDWYSFNILPKLGQLVAKDADSYRYLAESIRMHPNQEKLKEMIVKAGFDDCIWHNLSGGIVALHIAHKY